MMPIDVASAFLITLIYAAVGAFISLSDREPTRDDLFIWSSSYGATGAGLQSLLFLFTIGHG